MLTLTSALRTAIATGLLLACSAGTALAASNVVTFDAPGEYPIVIPDGVTSLRVVAVGGRGGMGTYSVPGGFGARVTADLPVTGGLTRYLLVGGNGRSGVDAAGAGGGGGGSDVRTAPASAGVTPTDPRILVAAGGGGSGFGHGHDVNGSAGYGGNAGAPGGSSRRSTYPGSITSGGGAAGVPAGTSAGGTSGAVDSAGAAGGAGSLGFGGQGSYADEHRGWTPGGFNGGGHGGGGAEFGPVGNVTYNGGGGGGGGLHGGGGGGGVMIFDGKSPRSAVGGAGGGGGSNLVPGGGSAVTDTVGQGSITVSFEDANAPVVSLDALPARVAGAIAISGTSGTVLGDRGVAIEVYAGATVSGAPIRTLAVTRNAATGSYHASLSGLGSGQYTVRAEQVDGAGNRGVSAARTVVVDTVAPVVSLTSPSDGTLTNDAAPSFGGVAGIAPGDDAAVEIEIRDASGAVVQAVSAQRDGTSGAYAATAASPLADGAYTAVATQSDDVGNQGSSSRIGFRVDTRGPAPSLSTRPEARTRVATPAFAGAAGTEAGDSAAVSVRIHAGAAAAGTPVATLGSAVDGSGRFEVAAARLADGTYTAAVTQADDAGNLGSSPPATFTVDTTAPALTLTTPSPGGRSASKPELAGIGGTAIGDSATVTIAVHAGSAATGPLVQTLVATRDPQSGAYRATSPFDLAVGTYTAVAAQADDVGNEAATAALTFTVDGTAPGGPGQGGPGQGGPGQGGPAADKTKPVLSRVSLSPVRFKVGTATTALTARAAKALKRGTSVRYTLSESATVTLAIARSGQRKTVGKLTRRSKQGATRIAFSGRLGSKALKPGRYVLTLTAVDAAGNRSAAKKVSFRVG